MTRILVFTGKGGVGKTSVAAATALEGGGAGRAHAACQHRCGPQRGRRAGSVHRPRVANVAENLDAVELDADRIMEEGYGDLVRSSRRWRPAWRAALPTRASCRPCRGSTACSRCSSCSISPKAAAGTSSSWKSHPRARRSRCSSSPNCSGGTWRNGCPWARSRRVLSPLSRKVLKVELPDKHAMTDVERLYARLLDLQELLKDGERTCVRIVRCPRRWWSRRRSGNYLYLNLFGYRVDGLVVNRMLPEAARTGFYRVGRCAAAVHGRARPGVSRCSHCTCPLARHRYLLDERRGAAGGRAARRGVFRCRASH